MGRPVKFTLYAVAGIVALLVIGVISFSLLFDPNDFRDRIAAETERRTGRELIIEGDLELSLFPWVAIGVGKTSLGNAPGFGDEPFASFEQARLSVRLLPMLLRREVSVGTAELESLRLNLAVARDGRSNWQDLIDAGEAAPDDDESAAGAGLTLDIASVNVSDAALTYSNARSGDTYRLTEVNMKSGSVSPGDPVPLSGGLSFDLQPDGISGTVELETVATFDTDASIVTLDDLSVDGLIEGIAEVPTTLRFETPLLEANTAQKVVTLGAVEMSVLGVDIEADVEPFSYADSPAPVATIQVAAFSPRSLLQRLNIEVPATADPNALGKAILDARARVSQNAIALTDVELVFDDTTLSGELSVPRGTGGSYRFDLAANSIDLNRYMAPPDEAATEAGEEAAAQIPAELIRPISARGSLTVREAYLGAMKFENVDLGLNVSNGNLRLHPVTAALYDGTYSGDVRIDASGGTPVLSVNEQINGVNLGSLARAMFEQESVTGTINGSFKLTGRGADLGAIQRSLAGNMNFELVDGAFEGTDIWYELRRARALFKKTAAPEPVLPARTKFSTVRATGPVIDGVFNNNDLLAELPFMQITGNGSVDFAAATIDYRMTARVLEKPEFVTAATAEELDEFTQAVIPLRITGPLTAPSVKPDVEAMLKERVKEEIRGRLVDKLLGGREEPPAADEPPATDAAPADGEVPDEPQEEEQDIEDKLKDSLKDIFKR